MRLSDIATYVIDKISSSDISLEEYVTTDCIKQNKRGREIATNLPPQSCSLIYYKPGDILIANIRPYLKKIWFADMEGGASSDVLVFRAKEGHSPEYLYAALLQDSFFNYVMQGAKGSKMPRGDKDQIMRYEMPTLSVSEESIGKFILDINRKIRLNEQINQNLEALAKQLYDYWFIQFDFPNEEGKPYKSCGGAMVWNDKLKREIPEGWNNGTVGDLFATQAGYAFKSSEWKECGHPVLTIKNIQEDGSVTFSDASFIDKYDCKLDKYSSNNGNMIFAMSGNTIGKIGIISSNIPNVLINQRVLIIKTNVKNIAFPYFVIKDKKIQNLVLQLGANSAQPNISEEEFRNIKICIPPKSIMDDFNQMFKDSFEKIINNRIEIDVLTKQRDELLPLLMNGQVTIE